MHQITVIEPKWLSEVAPTFFRVADQNKISKRKQGEKIEPLHDRFAQDKDDWVSSLTTDEPANATEAQQSQETSVQFTGLQEWRWWKRMVDHYTYRRMYSTSKIWLQEIA